MGHQLARAALAATLTCAFAVSFAACGGGGEEAEPPPVLDNVREIVDSARASAAADAIAEGEGDSGGDGSASVAELPPPDPSEFTGANRVVNLWVGPDGASRVIDVWGRRTFANGPILLVEGLGFGEASGYFSAPPGYRLSAVGAGAGPDGVELAGMFNADTGEQITMIYTNDDVDGSVWAPNLWEVDPIGAADTPDEPLPGMGLVYLYAANTGAFTDSLTASIGATSFIVGDGSGECREQRLEEQGYQAAVLGGTQPVQLDVPPGPATISLHPWAPPAGCEQPPASELVVDVPVDGTVMVVVYSTDGRTIDALQLPVS